MPPERNVSSTHLQTITKGADGISAHCAGHCHAMKKHQCSSSPAVDVCQGQEGEVDLASAVAVADAGQPGVQGGDLGGHCAVREQHALG